MTPLVPAPVRRPVHDLSDAVALGLTKLLRAVADLFFSKRYGHRAVVLETVAAVPGMVAATLLHLRGLRRMEGPDERWMHELVDEAENERMHLLTFLALAQPTRLERLIVLLAQGVFFNAFFLLYLLSPRTAHRLVGYFEEEAVVSYTRYLQEVEDGSIPDVAAPEIARRYWSLPERATLRDVIIAVRADEARHRDANHGYADRFGGGRGPVLQRAPEPGFTPPSGSGTAIGATSTGARPSSLSRPIFSAVAGDRSTMRPGT